MEFKQKISQNLIMTPQLKIAINLLSLSRSELIDKISEEIESNPVLEYSKETSKVYNYENEKIYNTETSNLFENSLKLHLNYRFKHDDSYYSNLPQSKGIKIENAYDLNTNISSRESLNDYLYKQLIFVSLTEKEKKIANFIIGNLSEDGYLKLPILEITKLTGENEHTVKKVLKEIKLLDPAGVCSSNLKECLLIQAKRISKKNKLVEEIISSNFIDLKYRRYISISRSLRVKVQDIIAAVNIISSFDPKPGLRFNHYVTEYIVPDLYVYENNGILLTKLNETDFPKLSINFEYVRSIHDSNFDKSAKKYINDRINSAIWIAKSINHRQKTIHKVMESILQLQKKFFQKGSSYLKPMVLRKVANDVGIHESTVSRTIKNKYVSTCRGTFELKYFFSNSVKCLTGNFLAPMNIQNKIRRMIKNENSSKPYSDKKISELLREENIDITRRTVTKYRKKMGIMPSNIRRKYFY